MNPFSLDIHSRKKCGIKIPHLMWMVIYAHPLCTYILLNVYVLCIRNFLHKKVWMFLAGKAHSRQLQHKPQQPAHTERQTKTTAAVSAGPAPQGLTCPLCAPRPAERAAAR